MASIEINTNVGCKLACTFCPQDKLVKKYNKTKSIKDLSYDSYKELLSRIPKHVRIDFSGMTEPFLNLEASKMVNHTFDQGYDVAQLRLGTMYEFGEGIPRDYEEAAKWYRISADQGQVKAQYNVGFMYENGRGVPQDHKEAVKWYRMSADQGDAMAKHKLDILTKKMNKK